MSCATSARHLGDTNRFAPLKGDPDAFERHPYILGVTNGFVDFANSGWYRIWSEIASGPTMSGG